MDNTQIVRTRIGKAFSTSMESVIAPDDIGFHMTDWDQDLEDLIALYQRPEAFTDDQIVSMLLKFLAHVPNHLAAAKKLAGMGPIEDVFDVGVLVEDEQ